MVNWRSTLITLAFVFATLVVMTSAVGIKKSEDAASNFLDVEVIEESTFEKMDYFSVNDGNKVMALNANSLRVVNQRDLYFTQPDGALYNEAGNKVAYTALEGEFKDLNKELKLEGEVKLVSKEGKYFADSLNYNGSTEVLRANGDVKATVIDGSTNDTLTVNADHMISWLKQEKSLFNGDVRGKIDRQRIYEGSFNFRAERMELDRLNSRVSLSDNVLLERNKYTLRAQRAEIFLENFNKKLKYYVLYDDIKLTEQLELPNGQTQVRKAFSEKLEGYMSQGKIVLTGAPRVEQGDDLIKGYQITLRENVELVEVEEAQSSFRLKRSKD